MPNVSVPACYRCSTQAKLRRNLTASGAEQYGWYCVTCERWAIKDRPFILRIEAARIANAYGKALGDIPTVGIDGSEPCRICGDTHTEMHHFAPQEFADKFDNYPAWAEITAPLCARHHSQWHELVQGRKIR